MAPPTPFVTVAMPCLDEARFIEACLASVQEQTYPRGQIEIFVADGGSTDGTREILARLAVQDRRIHVLDNPDRIQAAGLNRILKEANGDVIIRMDVHCEYAPEYIAKCVEVLERTGADNVGGAQRCRGRTEFEKAVCAALRSPLGMGGAAYRNADNEGFVDTVFLGAYRRSIFDRIGSWDPSFITNEDAELNQRLISSGGRIYLSREIVVHYSPRGSPLALVSQYLHYGRGRARTLAKHGHLLALRPALPFLFVTICVFLIVAFEWTSVQSYLAGIASVVVAAEALRVAGPGGLRRAALVVLILPSIVVSHAVGFGLGLLALLSSRD